MYRSGFAKHSSGYMSTSSQLIAGIWMIMLVIFVILEYRSTTIRRHVYSIKEHVQNSSCVPSPDNDGLMVHIDCPIIETSTFRAAKEFEANLKPFQSVFFDTRIEIYQNPLPSLYGGEWLDHIRSGHTINYWPYLPGVGRRFTKQLQAGRFLLDPQAASNFLDRVPVPLVDDGIYIPSPERPPTILNSTNTQLYENGLYSGNPFSPVTGDVRITFFKSSATHLSAIGTQAKANLWTEIGFGEPLRRLTPINHGYNTSGTILVAEGDLTSDRLLDGHEKKISSIYMYLNLTRCAVSILTAVVIITHFGSHDLLSYMVSILASLGLSMTIVALNTITYDRTRAITQIFSALAMSSASYFLSKSLVLTYSPSNTRGDPRTAVPEILLAEDERYAAI